MAPHRVAAAQNTAALLSSLTLASLGAALLGDPFTWVWLALVVVSAWDYSGGVRDAQATPGAYSPERRDKGRRAKVTTLMLMLAVRSLEAWATAYGILNVPKFLIWLGIKSENAPPGGIVAASITIFIVLEELGSIYGRSVANGGRRILALELLFNGAAAAQRKILGRAARLTAQWAERDAAAFTGSIEALRRMDEGKHELAYGTPAPERRHSDVARRELTDGESHPHAGPGSPDAPGANLQTGTEP
jgi:hypothetical protein